MDSTNVSSESEGESGLEIDAVIAELSEELETGMLAYSGFIGYRVLNAPEVEVLSVSHKNYVSAKVEWVSEDRKTCLVRYTDSTLAKWVSVDHTVPVLCVPHPLPRNGYIRKIGYATVAAAVLALGTVGVSFLQKEEHLPQKEQNNGEGVQSIIEQPQITVRLMEHKRFDFDERVLGYVSQQAAERVYDVKLTLPPGQKADFKHSALVTRTVLKEDESRRDPNHVYAHCSLIWNPDGQSFKVHVYDYYPREKPVIQEQPWEAKAIVLKNGDADVRIQPEKREVERYMKSIPVTVTYVFSRNKHEKIDNAVAFEEIRRLVATLPESRFVKPEMHGAEAEKSGTAYYYVYFHFSKGLPKELE